MKELFKYTIIMIMGLLLIAVTLNDSFGQAKILTANYIFTGEKTRFELTLSKPVKYTLVEDWENKTITLVLPGATYSNAAEYKIGQVHNYFISGVQFTLSDLGTALQISSKQDFRTNVILKDQGRRLLLDVFPQLTTLNSAILLQRGIAYESRGEYEKAVLQYKQAVTADPGNTQIKNKLTAVLNKIDKRESGDGFFSHTSNTSAYQSENNAQSADAKTVSQYNPAEKDSSNHSVKVVPLPIRKVNQLEQSLIDSLPVTAPDSDEKTQPQTNITDVISLSEAKDRDGIQSTINPAKSAGRFFGFQDLLKKSNTEPYVLWSLYVVTALLVFIAVLLLRKIIRLRKTVRRNKSVEKKWTYPGPGIKKQGNNGKKSDNQRKLEEMKSFARKLSALYAKTNSGGVYPSANDRAPIERSKRTKFKPVEEHSRKIEEAFTQDDLLWNDNKRNHIESEAVNLTKKFRDQNVKSDKYDAVRQLAEQNWEIWEIARELSMGTEEVKMALRSSHTQEQNNHQRELYERIYQLADIGLKPAVIALRLHIGEEEVKLALKLREATQAVS